MPVPMHVLRIDPERCNIELMMMEPDEFSTALNASALATIELGDGHALVVNDGEEAPDRSSRFRLDRSERARPIFGTALVVDLRNNNWASVSLTTADLLERIVWEKWDETALEYVPLVSAAQ